MSALATTQPRPARGVSVRRIADATLAVLVFLSGFVIVEPAPYDLALCGVMAVWAFCGLSIPRPILPLVLLLIVYCAGGLISFTQLDDFREPLIYWATTLFLALQAIFFAAVVPQDPARRFLVIERSYVAAALVAALLGVLGYFGAIPYSALFTLYERARGPFQDPNVFGPFLVLPLLVLARGMLTGRGGLATPARALGVLVLVSGIFLSFSRAAWGMTALALPLAAAFAFATEESGRARRRMIVLVILGIATLGLLLAVAIHVPAVEQLLVQRAALVQDYDAGRLGRFERHLIGLALIPEHPLGLGPFVFGHMFGADEHNMWLKGFLVYGWLGGFAYLALVGLTLAVAFPLLVRRTPWQGFLQCVVAVYLGHLVIHFVIDNDHWRHLFLIYGLIWAAHAVDRRGPARQPPRNGTRFGR
ncbi:O-antigen ligase family protein [Prosthecomicrobium pneumaticum]|uniref:O-antigen polymerase n=1 Tax=Prosthecomicrobium pneumaticum TaxID=81895 RepID=A0A7W9L3P9_9HYPH|nr:hypothetical protein [Prosthecomicrobium pneumaticum]MBB5754778.1 hypothetical protein [Prosthecomicrobium pneumaticum]